MDYSQEKVTPAAERGERRKALRMAGNLQSMAFLRFIKRTGWAHATGSKSKEERVCPRLLGTRTETLGRDPHPKENSQLAPADKKGGKRDE